jgi:protease inhibitor Inh
MACIRTTNGLLVALILTGCAGEQVPLETGTFQDASIPGRWILATPNAPSCGFELSGAPGARTGTIAPDGGCPGNLYLGRHWSMEGNTLTINDDKNQFLARLNLVGTRFEGLSSTGIEITLSRQQGA